VGPRTGVCVARVVDQMQWSPRSGRRIAQLASQNKKWLALNQKLSTRLIDSNSSTPFRLAVSRSKDERTHQRNGNPALQSQAPLRCFRNINHSQPLPNLWQFWFFRHFKIATEFPSGRHDGVWPMNLSTQSMNHFMLGASVWPPSCWRQASCPSSSPRFTGGIFAVR
jgi:hypothetical protein